VEVEALRSSLLQSRLLPKTLWFPLPKDFDVNLALRTNSKLIYYVTFYTKLLYNHYVTLDYNFNLKTVMKYLTLLK
jgi:hypothetical protein